MTAEEMAEEYASNQGDDNILDFGGVQINLSPLKREAFLAGLKAGNKVADGDLPPVEKGSEKGFDLNGLCKIAHKIEQCVNTVTMLVRCSAEMHDAAKAYVKHVTERTNETKRHFASKLVDIVVCCMIVAEHEGVDLENALVDCIEKNRKRAEGVGDKK